VRKLLLGTTAAVGLAAAVGTGQAAVVDMLVRNGPGGGTSTSAGVQA